jgi:hypothetical protein
MVRHCPFFKLEGETLSGWDIVRWDIARWDIVRWDFVRWDIVRWDIVLRPINNMLNTFFNKLIQPTKISGEYFLTCKIYLSFNRRNNNNKSHVNIYFFHRSTLTFLVFSGHTRVNQSLSNFQTTRQSIPGFPRKVTLYSA